ncbi:hypothetical protein [Deinococcus geothermalis]|uniref:hypothetical protein n=1 Tax=Deinococcus geothermalis TaxID=68909 RepID=UPI002352DD40|nr:hypothetical protein [Deinococcus geothermalis]
MRHKFNALTPLLAATFLASSAMATASKATAALPATPHAVDQRPQSGPTHPLKISYYRGDPLAGGQRLQTVSFTPRPGLPLFQNVPTGATYAVVTTPFGQSVVKLSDVRGRREARQPGPGDTRGPDGPQDRDPGQEQPRPQGAAQTPFQDNRGARAGLQDGQTGSGALEHALRGASRVTFYDGDPLAGGRVIESLRLDKPASNQAAALTQAARGAKFAVIERPGERLIVALGAAQPGPQGPQGPDSQGR